MDVVHVLCSKNGCRWDKYKVENLREELGDMLLQVTLHSVIGEEHFELIKK